LIKKLKGSGIDAIEILRRNVFGEVSKSRRQQNSVTKPSGRWVASFPDYTRCNV